MPKKKPSVIQEPIQYEVEEVLAYRLKPAKEYKIRWKGYSSKWDTWEPAENIEASAIESVEIFRENEKLKKDSKSTVSSQKRGNKRGLKSRSNPVLPEPKKVKTEVKKEDKKINKTNLTKTKTRNSARLEQQQESNNVPKVPTAEKQQVKNKLKTVNNKVPVEKSLVTTNKRKIVTNLKKIMPDPSNKKYVNKLKSEVYHQVDRFIKEAQNYTDENLKSLRVEQENFEKEIKTLILMMECSDNNENPVETNKAISALDEIGSKYNLDISEEGDKFGKTFDFGENVIKSADEFSEISEFTPKIDALNMSREEQDNFVKHQAELVEERKSSNSSEEEKQQN